MINATPQCPLVALTLISDFVWCTQFQIDASVLNRALPLSKELRNEVCDSIAFSEYPALPVKSLDSQVPDRTLTFPFRCDRDLM